MPEGAYIGEETDIFRPIRSGDIYRIMTHGYDRIGIIDGVFHGVPSIWHREISNAIEHGIEVYGSSSMGALRAAEMERQGVIGIGQVYEWYSSDQIVGDDEVALSHLPEYPYEALTIPLVDIRNALANRMGLSLSSSIHTQVIELCRTIPYWDRTVQTLSSVFEGNEMMRPIYKSILQHIRQMRSIKKVDAEMLIGEIQANKFIKRDTWKINEIKPPSLRTDLYSDFALELRLDRQGEPFGSSISSKGVCNQKRSALVHSFLSYWIDDKDPYGLRSEGMEKAHVFLKENIVSKEDIGVYGVMINEMHSFVFWSYYFYSILENRSVTISERLIRSARTYLEHNPAKDQVLASFQKFENLQSHHGTLVVLAHEMHLVEQAFKEYSLDMDNLLEIYTSIFRDTRIKNLDMGLQRYILIGTFGSSVLGCLESVVKSHIVKFERIGKYRGE